jgi:hypothetical protein
MERLVVAGDQTFFTIVASLKHIKAKIHIPE